MKTYITTLFIFLITAPISAQELSFKEFIPAGYIILDTARGDMNNDGYHDYLLILKNNLEKLVPDTTRPLLILHGQQDGTLELIARNDRVVLCLICGGVFGDPYSGISVDDNSFSIAYYGGSAWRWSRVTTFIYDNISGKYILLRDISESFHATEPDKTESHIYYSEAFGRKVEFENYKTEW